MPKKSLDPCAVPTLVQERLTLWGRAIRRQRLRQRVTAADLAARLGISPATLRRIEQGDPGAGASTYLSAFLVLGFADEAVPPLDASLWAGETRQRIREGSTRRRERDDDYF